MTYLNYEIGVPDSDEADALDEALLEEIQKTHPFTLDKPFVPLNICARLDGQIVGGVLAYAVMWDILYIDTVWVRVDCRNKGLASYMLAEAEERAAKMGCKTAHLSTYDFQAPYFYLKCGYEKFGEIDYGHSKEIFYYKKIKE